jgi:hypothetical protein
LRVADDRDGVVHDDGLPVFSLLHGPIKPVSLGDAAPAAEIQGIRFLDSADGKRTVNRTAGGDALLYRTNLGTSEPSEDVVQPVEARTLEQPDTRLAWRFLDPDGRNPALVLIGRDDELLWVHGEGHVAEPRSAPIV